MQAEPDIRSKPGARYPDGPSTLLRYLSGRAFRETSLDWVLDNARRYGDMVHIHTADGHAYQFNHPTLIGEMVVDHERRNRRVRTMQRARGLLGDGLLTSEEPLHMRQRRLAQPAFHRDRIAAYGEVIGNYAAQMSEEWQPGEQDLHPDMLLLALRITGKCLFGIDSDAAASEITAAVSAFMVPPPPAWIPARWLEPLQSLRIGPVKKVYEGVARLDAFLFRMIDERRADPHDRGDLLSMLMSAEDTEAISSDPAARQMSDKQVRDECVTVLLAGHETTANALSFSLWLLAKHPDVQETACREAQTVLGERVADAADYGRLRYLYMVFAETMRLLPTVWTIGRSSGPEPYSFRGFTIEPGATLLAPQVAVHRDPRFWDSPEIFEPTRFSEEKRVGRHKFAYFPFGGGSRQCIGEGLAWMEGVLALASILRKWKLVLPAGAPAEMPLSVSVNLRPAKGTRLILQPR